MPEGSTSAQPPRRLSMSEDCYECGEKIQFDARHVVRYAGRIEQEHHLCDKCADLVVDDRDICVYEGPQAQGTHEIVDPRYEARRIGTA
jgi:hypothetical protein